MAGGIKLVGHNDSEDVLMKLNDNSKRIFSEYVKSQEAEQKTKESVFGKTKETNRTDVVLFVSFDISNSTYYKTKHYDIWPVVLAWMIRKIKESVRESSETSTAQAEVWRVLGDEVIFVVRLTDIEQVYASIDGFYDVLIRLCNEIDDGTFFRLLPALSRADRNSLKLDNKLSIKAAAWIAIVTNVANINLLKANDTGYFIENIHDMSLKKGEYEGHDFLGIDIDTGFRIAENTLPRQMALSFELACLLSDQINQKENLYIVTYKTLRGVWDYRDYPIIWYYDKTKNKSARKGKKAFGCSTVSNKEVSLIDSLPYDAASQNPLYEECIINNPPEGPKKNYSIKDGVLERIARDCNLDSKIRRIKRIIKKKETSITPYVAIPRLELHCAVVCINSRGEALVAKRGEGRMLPLKWEVGCAKADSRKELIETIKEEYKNDFQIDIELLCDEKREDKQPHPISIYTVPDGNERHVGVIFVAEIISGEATFKKGKHLELKFVTEKTVNSMKKEECVPDLIDTIKEALEYYHKVKG